MDDLELFDFFEEEEPPFEEVEDALADLEGSSEELRSLEDEEVVKVEEPVKAPVAEEKPKKTGEVDRYSSTTLTYPCFILDSSTEFPKHVISALSRMIESSLVLENVIKVYIRNNSEMLSLGGISSLQVKATIDLLGRDNIEAYYSSNYLLKDDLIYALSE